MGPPMGSKDVRRPLALASAILWLATVLAAYYTDNVGYYQGKLGVFGRFLFGGG